MTSAMTGAGRMGVLLLVALAAHPVFAHGDWPPKHGGVMNDGETSFELVARERGITLYLEDHGTPIATDGALGTFTVQRGGSERTVKLLPAGGNRLTAVVADRLVRDDRVMARVTLKNGSVAVGRFVWR